MKLDHPAGWQEVPLQGAGAGPDGNSLATRIVQLVILENHQNGKDTHIRGLKIYAKDDDAIMADDGRVNTEESSIAAAALCSLSRDDPPRTQVSQLRRDESYALGTGSVYPPREIIGYLREGNTEEQDYVNWASELRARVQQEIDDRNLGEVGRGSLPDFMREPELR